MEDVKNIHDKIDKVGREVNIVKVSMAKIETMLEQGLIKRIEILERKQEYYEEETKSRQKWTWTILIPMLLKQIYDLLITVS